MNKLFSRRSKAKHYNSVESRKMWRLLTNSRNKFELNGEESFIKAGYTYLGQFIAHEIVSSTSISTKEVTSKFNLKSLYGDLTNLDIFDRNGKFIIFSSGNGHVDFIRNSTGAYLLPEKRNDENIIISQFHCFWMCLHNVLLMNVNYQQIENIKDRIIAVRETLIRLFHHIIFNDYLKVILDQNVYKTYTSNGIDDLNLHLLSENYFDNSVPLEFSHAAFRFGHSMIRNDYKINKNKILSLDELFITDQMRSENITEEFRVNWNLFFHELVECSQHAFKINLRVSPEMKSLRERVSSKVHRQDNIASINLNAGSKERLLSGYQIYNLLMRQYPNLCSEIELKQHEEYRKAYQEIRNQFVEVNLPSSISGYVFNKYLKNQINFDRSDNLKYKKEFSLIEKKINSLVLPLSVDKLPLWLFVLFESEFENQGSKLGKVSSILICETILNSMKGVLKKKSIKTKNDLLIKEIFEVEPESLKMNNLINFIGDKCYANE